MVYYCVYVLFSQQNLSSILLPICLPPGTNRQINVANVLLVPAFLLCTGLFPSLLKL